MNKDDILNKIDFIRAFYNYASHNSCDGDSYYYDEEYEISGRYDDDDNLVCSVLEIAQFLFKKFDFYLTDSGVKQGVDRRLFITTKGGFDDCNAVKLKIFLTKEEYEELAEQMEIFNTTIESIIERNE